MFNTMTGRTIIIQADGLNLAPLLAPLWTDREQGSALATTPDSIRVTIIFQADCEFRVNISKAAGRRQECNEPDDREQHHG